MQQPSINITAMNHHIKDKRTYEIESSIFAADAFNDAAIDFSGGEAIMSSI